MPARACIHFGQGRRISHRSSPRKIGGSIIDLDHRAMLRERTPHGSWATSIGERERLASARLRGGATNMERDLGLVDSLAEAPHVFLARYLAA
jgi:hypothetical protein